MLGDRRRNFLWSGSVLDSVIGAYLTQNVADHLSSSAFMILASRFPPPTAPLHEMSDSVDWESVRVADRLQVCCVHAVLDMSRVKQEDFFLDRLERNKSWS